MDVAGQIYSSDNFVEDGNVHHTDSMLEQVFLLLENFLSPPPPLVRCVENASKVFQSLSELDELLSVSDFMHLQKLSVATGSLDSFV